MIRLVTFIDVLLSADFIIFSWSKNNLRQSVSTLSFFSQYLTFAGAYPNILKEFKSFYEVKEPVPIAGFCSLKWMRVIDSPWTGH